MMFRHALVISLFCSVGCATTSGTAQRPRPRYHAEIRRTSYGIPHILASDQGSAGYGQGFAFAQDHACVLLDRVLKIRGERSRYFGPGPDDANVLSDLGYRALDARGRASV